MCAEVSNGDSLKKAVRKHEKKLRQIEHLEEQSSSRKLTKEEIKKVQSKENVQKELNELSMMIESVEIQHNANSEHASKNDKGIVDDSMATGTDTAVSRRSLTPTKRPHVMDLPLSEAQNDSTKIVFASDVNSGTLSEPVTKRRKDAKSIEMEAQGLSQLWCNKQFIVSKLDGHNDVICSLDCNQDLLLTGSRDTSLKVWNLHTFEMLHHMGGHTSVVTCVRLVPSSVDLHEKLIDHQSVVGLSGSLDCSVKMWNLDTGQLICSVYVFSPITCMDYWCGGRVVIGTEGGKVDVWNIKKGENIYTIRYSTIQSKPVTCIKVFQDHIYCADTSIQKWQLGSENHATLLLDTAHMMPSKRSCGTIRCFCIHDNNIFWGDNGVNLKVYNCLTGVVKKYPTHAGKHVITGAMVVSNDAILCGGYDEDQGTSYINVHSLCDGERITTLTDNSSEYITCMACLEGTSVMPSSGSSVVRLVTGGNNAELKVWDMLSSNISPSETLQSSSLKSYQHTIKTPLYVPSPSRDSHDTDDSRDSDDNSSTQGDIVTDVDLHNQPLPNPRPQPSSTQESSTWCSIL